MKSEDNTKIVNELESYQEKIRLLEQELAQIKGKESDALDELKPDILFDEIEEFNEQEYLDSNSFNLINIEPSYGVMVMSLVPVPLNIVCGEYTKQHNTYYIPEQFGRIIIPYRDIELALQHQLDHLKQGRYIILDQNVIKKHGLAEYQNKILNEKKLKAIFSEQIPVDTAISLYKSTDKFQQKEITRKLVDLLTENENNLSAYFVSKFSRDCQVNLEELAKTNREYLDQLKNTNQRRDK